MTRTTTTTMTDFAPQHFLWEVQHRIATIRLNRPDRKNPLTFESYAELRDTFRALPYADDVDVVVFASNGGNFCSGGDVQSLLRYELFNSAVQHRVHSPPLSTIMAVIHLQSVLILNQTGKVQK